MKRTLTKFEMDVFEDLKNEIIDRSEAMFILDLDSVEFEKMQREYIKLTSGKSGHC